jgi:hypothetical protein
MSITRRSLIAGVLSFAAAPAIVKPASLMPLWVPKAEVLTDPWTVFVDLQLKMLARDLDIPFETVRQSMHNATYSAARECLLRHMRDETRRMIPFPQYVELATQRTAFPPGPF